jgi:hypothetical protein
MIKIDPEEYRKSFIESSDDPNKIKEIHKKAYKIANDNRKFEISNYWKRANYYWLFQASVYAGYFYSITAENNEYLCKNPEIIVGVTCLGFLTALAWLLSNKGSKQWQENWENHVFKLENGITGPLYKTTSNENTWSVSKINELVSFFSALAWFLLGLKSVQMFFGYPLAFVAYLLIISLITSIFYFCGKGLVKSIKISWFKIEVHDD